MMYYTIKNKPKVVSQSFKGGVTQQHFKEETDVNQIVKKYMRTGVLGNPLSAPTEAPKFSTFDQNFDYFGAQCFIAKAQQEFEALPAVVRKRFDNDPGQLIAFLSDEKNRPEAENLGLVEPRPEEQLPAGSDLPLSQTAPAVEPTKVG